MWAGGGCVCGVRGTAALMCLSAFRFSLSSLAHALHASSSWCVALRGPVSKGSFFFSFPDIWYTFIKFSLLVPDQLPDHEPSDHDADPP